MSSPWEDLLSCGWVLFAKEKGGSRQRQGGSEGSGKVLGSLRSLDSSLMDPGGLKMGELEKGCRYKQGWMGCMPARALVQNPSVPTTWPVLSGLGEDSRSKILGQWFPTFLML